MIKLLTVLIRSIVGFPLFQLAIVVTVILFLQAADYTSARGQIFNGLDKLVEFTVGLFSALFNVKSFTKSWLTTGFWIAELTSLLADLFPFAGGNQRRG